MANLTVQEMPVDGFFPTFSAADAAGDSITSASGHFLLIDNANTVDLTATIDIPVGVGFYVSRTVTVTAGAELWVPIPDRNMKYHDGLPVQQGNGDGLVHVSYSSATSVTIAAVAAR